MAEITLGQVLVAVSFIGSMITGIGYISTSLRKWIRETMQEQMSAIDRSLDELADKIDTVDMESCKNYLVQTISNLEKGAKLDEIERERFYEQLSHYEHIGGNSYIKRKVEELICTLWL